MSKNSKHINMCGRAGIYLCICGDGYFPFLTLADVFFAGSCMDANEAVVLNAQVLWGAISATCAPNVAMLQVRCVSR